MSSTDDSCNFQETYDENYEEDYEVDPDYQPPPDEVAFAKPVLSPSDTFGQLRGYMDGSDVFMTSHQVHRIRRYQKQTPDWTKSDSQIREVLLRAFPRLNQDSRQREQAGRWMRVIHLYWRVGYNQADLEMDLRISRSALKALLQSIKRVARGLRADGSGERRRRLAA